MMNFDLLIKSILHLFSQNIELSVFCILDSNAFCDTLGLNFRKKNIVFLQFIETTTVCVYGIIPPPSPSPYLVKLAIPMLLQSHY